jgi:malate dehydrogenase (oxaloacetate-decarboxylating)
VAQAAIQEGLAQFHPETSLEAHIEDLFWQPKYIPFKRSA